MFTRMGGDTDSGLISSITPDIMTCLRRSLFFERLDDCLCPKEESRGREVCAGKFRISEQVLQASAVDAGDLQDIFNVLKAQGGCCDCEILYNVVESSRLKAEYWKSRVHASGANPKHPDEAQSTPSALYYCQGPRASRILRARLGGPL